MSDSIGDPAHAGQVLGFKFLMPEHKNMTTNEIREKFLHFFKEKGHTVVPSDSLIPSGDPSLLFTSAGMVQFKKHFLGQTRLEYRRACSSQKCLRTSDIGKVGLTARHLTFFEMLGNFSFGDYFKKEAIEWGWEFLTKECGLKPSLLWASVYTEDDESYQLWKKILPESKIVRLGEDSNFWNMGPTGPCGPCSEILFDQGEKMGCQKSSCGPGCDCDRYLEVWNLVFTQFDKQPDGKLIPLPQKNIDTGMGLERLSVVTNGLHSNFEIDIFQSIMNETKKLLKSSSEQESDYRIIADHVRACTFLICDGILPSNEGRGYILRRLLRRSLRKGWINGRKKPFLNLLVPIVVKEMESAYSELHERIKNIQSIIETEEKNTLQTIEAGTQYLLKETAKNPRIIKTKDLAGKVHLPGEKVFYIYDTFGLDKEIQKEILSDSKLELIFSEEEYKKAQEKAIEIARKGWKGSGEKDVTIYSKLLKKINKTVFKGYETLECKTKVAAILKTTVQSLDLEVERQKDSQLKTQDSGQNLVLQEATKLEEGEEGEIILVETPFYAESGGQVGDKGVIESKVQSPKPVLSEVEGSKVDQENTRLTTQDSRLFLAEVMDTQNPVEDLIVHHVKVSKGTVKVGDEVTARVDEHLRKQTMRHHTATHLLHAALRKILGTHVTQSGSLVSPEKLRFDFTYPKALTQKEFIEIEKEVNAAICANVPRKRGEYSLEDARKQGALAFFGEKYGEKVFVVHYENVSVEVCGGTHCLSTGEIGFFKIISESSIGSGVRRIEAATGEKALEFVQNMEKQLRLVAEKLRCAIWETAEKVDKMSENQTEIERELFALKKRQHTQKSDLTQNAKIFSLGKKSNDKIKIVSEIVEPMSMESLRELSDVVRDKLSSGIVLLASKKNEETAFVVTLTKDCVEKGFRAGEIAKEFAGKIGGKGGGKEFFAQGGGKSVPNLEKILESFPEEIVQENRQD